jgi:hypothetical protein
MRVRQVRRVLEALVTEPEDIEARPIASNDFLVRVYPPASRFMSLRSWMTQPAASSAASICRRACASGLLGDIPSSPERGDCKRLSVARVRRKRCAWRLRRGLIIGCVGARSASTAKPTMGCAYAAALSGVGEPDLARSLAAARWLAKLQLVRRRDGAASHGGQ